MKAAVEEYGGVDKVPITLDTVKTAEKSYRLYNEHLREEQAKERQKAQKRKLEEMKANEKNWHEKLKKLRTEEQDAKEAMDRAMSYIDQGGQKINKGLKINDMMEVEAGQKLIEFGIGKQGEANKRLKDISEERNKIENELFKIKETKKCKT